MAPILYMQAFSAPCRAVLLTASALGLNLEKRIIDLSKKEHLSEGYLKLNPQHSIPVLDDNGTVIWDSHAINAYLVGKYGKDDLLYPKDLAKRAVVDQRLHFDSGMVFNWLRYIARGMKHKGRRALTEDQTEGVEESYDHLNTFLKSSQWVAGANPTIADFSLIANLTTLDFLHRLDQDKYPNVANWLAKAKTLPYYDANIDGLEEFKIMMKPLIS